MPAEQRTCQNCKNQFDIDGDSPKQALYVHWLCVSRNFAGQGFSREMVDFAGAEARRRHLPLLRLDANADEKKLCDLYESMGFRRVGTESGKDHPIAFYQKEVSVNAGETTT